MPTKTLSRWVISGFFLLLAACSSLPLQKPEAPDVTLASVKLAKLGLKYQVLAFELNVFNPNSYTLPVDALNFVAIYQGEPLAQGASEQAVKLPAGQTTPLTINVKTKINKVLLHLLEATASKQDTLDITIDGYVKLGNWPARVPFSVDKSFKNIGLEQFSQ